VAILTRVTRKEHPGAIVEVRVPYVCTRYPTIQEMMTFLEETVQPSVIIGGKIYTEYDKLSIETACELP